MPCIHCLVSGRVQGVFFRASTCDRAQALGLVGEVRNLPDGRVAVTACGPQATLDVLQRWLWEGPRQAAVSDVQCTACPEEAGFSRFEIA
ncbi:MAG: acylphosphatase [Gammaproteobacteria bacterium]